MNRSGIRVLGEGLYARLNLEQLDRAEGQFVSPSPAGGSVFKQVEFWVTVFVDELGGTVFGHIGVVVVSVERVQSCGHQHAAGSCSVVGHGPEFKAHAAGAVGGVVCDLTDADVSAAVIAGSEIGVTTSLVGTTGVVGLASSEGVSPVSVKSEEGGFGFRGDSDKGNKRDGGGDDFVGDGFHGSGVVVGGLVWFDSWRGLGASSQE